MPTPPDPDPDFELEPDPPYPPIENESDIPDLPEDDDEMEVKEI